MILLMQEKVFFANCCGIDLCGILSGPEPMPDVPAVVLCHGFATGKDGRTATRLEASLNRAGIATLRFDFFGHGESGGDIADITVSEAADNVFRAIRYTREQGYHRIALFGSSFGGLAALLAAAGPGSLVSLSLKSPVSDYLSRLFMSPDSRDLDSWRRQGFFTFKHPEGKEIRLNFTFHTDAERVRAYDVARDIRVPTLIVHGEADASVPVAQSRRLAELLPEGRIEIIPGADHRFSREEDFERMLTLISEFIVRRFG